MARGLHGLRPARDAPGRGAARGHRPDPGGDPGGLPEHQDLHDRRAADRQGPHDPHRVTCGPSWRPRPSTAASSPSTPRTTTSSCTCTSGSSARATPTSGNMPLVHSAMSEDISFRRVLRLARYVEGAAVYFVHVSAGRRRGRHRRGARRGPRRLRRDAPPLRELHRRGLSPARRRASSTRTPRSSTRRIASGSGAGSGRHAEHRRHRRALHAARDQGAEPPRRRRDRRPRRRRDARAHHLHGGRVQARDVARALRRGDVDAMRRRSSGSIRRRAPSPPGSDADSSSSTPPCAARCASEDLHGSDYSAWDGWEVHGWPSRCCCAARSRSRTASCSARRATAAASRASWPPRSRTAPPSERAGRHRCRAGPVSLATGPAAASPGAFGKSAPRRARRAAHPT